MIKEKEKKKTRKAEIREKVAYMLFLIMRNRKKKTKKPPLNIAKKSWI